MEFLLGKMGRGKFLENFGEWYCSGNYQTISLPTSAVTNANHNPGQIMNARLIGHSEKQTSVVMHAATAAEAAKMLGVSESTVRNAAKKLGVKQISGRAVAGFVLFKLHPVDVALNYSR